MMPAAYLLRASCRLFTDFIERLEQCMFGAEKVHSDHRGTLLPVVSMRPEKSMRDNSTTKYYSKRIAPVYRPIEQVKNMRLPACWRRFSKKKARLNHNEVTGCLPRVAEGCLSPRTRC